MLSQQNASVLIVLASVVLPIFAEDGADVLDTAVLAFAENAVAPSNDCPAEPRACVAGWRQNSKCSPRFTYKGQEREGCITDDHDKPWCGELGSSPVFGVQLWWEDCLQCTESSSDNSDTNMAHIWQYLTTMLSCKQVSVTTGNAQGRLNSLINGYPVSRNSDLIWIMSAGKWAGTVPIAGVVADPANDLQFDTHARDVFEWWTQDPADSKYGVQLRHLLQFASGFKAFEGVHGWLTVGCIHKGADYKGDIETCARDIHDNAIHQNLSYSAEHCSFEQYNSMHQVVALAMASKMTGKHPQAILSEYLYVPAGMNNTKTEPYDSPVVAAWMRSTVEDYDLFLQRYTAGKLLPQNIMDVVETPRQCSGGDGEPPIINAMGHSARGSVHMWGGTFEASVNRATNEYVLIAPQGPFYIERIFTGSRYYIEVMTAVPWTDRRLRGGADLMV